jgi:hypothetical protein
VSITLFKDLMIGVLTIVAALVLLMLVDDEVFSQRNGPISCLDQETQDRVRQLMSRSYDQAFSHHTAQLYEIWVKDYSPEPPRAIKGMSNNISAYSRAKATAENWKFPVC